ncbi:MAG TPA: hypothetical protein VF954_02395 [Acidimicrobiales bacterium]
MEAGDVRSYCEAHGKAVVDGDQAHIMADVAPEALAGLAPVGAALPQPVRSAQVDQIDLAGDKAVVRITYTGESGAVTVESQWEERDGRPKIVAASVV